MSKKGMAVLAVVLVLVIAGALKWWGEGRTPCSRQCRRSAWLLRWSCFL